MSEIKEPKFEIRKGIGIFFVGDHNPGEAFNIDNIYIGDSLTLKVCDIRILVRVEEESNNNFIGKIYGFEPIMREFEDLTVGDLVSFNEGNIFSCGRKKTG